MMKLSPLRGIIHELWLSYLSMQRKLVLSGYTRPSTMKRVRLLNTRRVWWQKVTPKNSG